MKRLLLPVIVAFALGITLTSTATAVAQRPKPAVIIRDTGGFAGPSFDFTVFSDLKWKFNKAGQKPISGMLTKDQLTTLVTGLKETGVADAESIRPSPAPHSQILIQHGDDKISKFLQQDNAIMAKARELAKGLME